MSDIRNIDIRRLDGGLLLIFRELLRLRRGSDVATYLGLSQPAVSHALARLRELLDDPLFVRKSHGLEPTRRAIELGPKVEAILDMAVSILEPSSAFDPTKSDRCFVISAPLHIMHVLAVPLTRLLREQSPKVTFEIQPYHSGSIAELNRMEVDLVIGAYAEMPTGVINRLLYTDHFCVVASKDHPKIRNNTISLEQIGEIEHIFASSRTKTAGGNGLPSPRLIPRRAVVGDWHTALLMISQTDAIGACPRRFAEMYASQLNIQLLESPYDTKPIQVSITRRIADNEAAVDWFVNCLEEAAA